MRTALLTEGTPEVTETEAVMATQIRQDAGSATEPAVIMRAVTTPAAMAVCGDCRHHVPRCTSSGSWCSLVTVQLAGQDVEAGQIACSDFASWPEGSPVPAFLAAMRF